MKPSSQTFSIISISYENLSTRLNRLRQMSSSLTPNGLTSRSLPHKSANRKIGIYRGNRASNEPIIGMSNPVARTDVHGNSRPVGMRQPAGRIVSTRNLQSTDREPIDKQKNLTSGISANDSS